MEPVIISCIYTSSSTLSLGVPEEHFPMLFARSLEGPALSWFYYLHPRDRDSWDEIMSAFCEWVHEYQREDERMLTLKLTNQAEPESFSHFCSRCSNIRATLLEPITDREFMLILLRNLNDFYYRHMVSFKYTSLAHMEQHGYDIDVMKLQEIRRKTAPRNPAQGKKFTPLDEPMSFICERLPKRGILKTKASVYSETPSGVFKRDYCTVASMGI